MKRIVSILLAFVLSITVLPTAIFAAEGSMDNFKQSQSYTEGQFKDVASDTWYAGSVKKAYELGLVKGSSATSFSPPGTMTLAEVITLACRLHSIYTTGTASFEQTDVWYQVYVDYALANKIIDAPYTNYTTLATRSEFAKILSKALPEDALYEINRVDDNAIPDVSSTAVNAEAIYLLYRAGILTGSDNYGSFQPNSSITRSEVAAIVTRMADRSLRKNISLTRTFYDGEAGKLVFKRTEATSDGRTVVYLDYTNPKSYPVFVQPLALEINGYNFRLYDTLWLKNEIAEANTTTELAYIVNANYNYLFEPLKQFDFMGNVWKLINTDGNTITFDTSVSSFIDAPALTVNSSRLQPCPEFGVGTTLYSDDSFDIIYIGVQSLSDKSAALLYVRNKSNDYLYLTNKSMSVNGQTYTDTINSFASEVNPTNYASIVLPQSQGEVHIASQNSAWGDIQTIGGAFDVKLYDVKSQNVNTSYPITIPAVYVGEKVDATAVSLDKTTQSLIVGQTTQLKAIVWPEHAVDRSVTFSSSNPAVATVNSSGLITAVKKGTATITAKSVNGKTASCTVTVDKLASVRIMYTNVGINSAGGAEPYIYWCNNSGKTIKYITFTAIPYNAVGDSVACTISGKKAVNLKITGPIEMITKEYDATYKLVYYHDGTSSQVSSYRNDDLIYKSLEEMQSRKKSLYYGNTEIPESEYINIAMRDIWNPAWYNSTIKSIRITKISIEYMDGTKESISNPPVVHP